MPWKECSVMDERMQFVARRLASEPMAELAHEQPHEFEMDETVPKFKGWHSFRASLATNLYTLGVKPAVIQAILRHSDVGTTLQYYVEVPEQESREALEKLQHLVYNR